MKDSEIFNVGVVIGAVIFLRRGVQGAVSSSLFLDSEIFHGSVVAGAVIFLSGGVQGAVSSSL